MQNFFLFSWEVFFFKYSRQSKAFWKLLMKLIPIHSNNYFLIFSTHFAFSTFFPSLDDDWCFAIVELHSSHIRINQILLFISIVNNFILHHIVRLVYLMIRQLRNSNKCSIKNSFRPHCMHSSRNRSHENALCVFLTSRSYRKHSASRWK